MPTMTIRVTNAKFESTSVGEFDTLDNAYRTAISSGLGIAAGEVAAGMTTSIVQLAVDTDEQKDAMRGSVAVATARVLNASDAAAARAAQLQANAGGE